MRLLAADTPPHIEVLQLARLQQMPPWQKLALAAQMNQMVHTFVVCLRRCYLAATDAEIRHYLAEQRLGADLAACVFVPVPMPGSLDDQRAG